MLTTLFDRPFVETAFTSPSTSFTNTPISEGGGSTFAPRQRTVVLDGWEYAIDLERWRSGNRRTLRDSTAIAGQPTDSLFDTNGAWARYRDSWHQGAGQPLDDLGNDELTPYRFNVAANCHVWTNGALTLQEGWDRQSALSGSTGTASAMCIANNYALVSNGLKTYQAPGPDFTTWTEVTGMNGAKQIATDGVTFYCACGSAGLYTVQAGTNTGALLGSAVNCDTVGFAANRLLVGNAHELYEVQAAGTRTLVKTHFQTSYRWNVIFAIGSRIYVGGAAGSRGELYSLTTSDTGALVLSAEAAPLEPSEYLLNAVSYAGFVVLLSNRGARFGQVGADGTLTYGPVVRAGFGGVSQKGLAVGGGYAWFAQYVDGLPAIVELDLTTFVDTLRPAYNVIARSTADVYGDLVYADASGEAKKLLAIDQVTSTVARLGFSASDELVTGYVETGLIRFGTVEDKVLVDMKVTFDPLPSNVQVTAEVRRPDDALVAIATTAVEASSTLEFSLGNTTVAGCYVRLTMQQTLGGGLTTPTIRSWRIRAYPVPPFVREWVVPIIAHDAVTIGSGDGSELRQVPSEILERLIALCESKAPTTFVIGGLSHQVRVEDVEETAIMWSTDGRSLQSIILVRLVGV